MKIGILLPNIRPHVEGSAESDGGVHDCLRIARRAEALGFDSVWLSDHVVTPAGVQLRIPYGDPEAVPLAADADIYDPLVLLSALAQTTERLTIGVSVLAIPYRHPLVAAKMLSTADQLAGGRVVLGAGAGWARPEFQALGLPDGYFAKRTEVTEDYLRAIKEAWLNTGPSWYVGEYVRFTNVGTFPHPVRKPHIPIWLGGDSEWALRTAVRLGEGFIATSCHPAQIGAIVEQLQRIAERDRRDPAELTVAMVGTLTLTRRPAAAGQSALTGSADQLVETLRTYERAGLQELIANVANVAIEGQPSLEATLAALEAVARGVLPLMRRTGRESGAGSASGPQ